MRAVREGLPAGRQRLSINEVGEGSGKRRTVPPQGRRGREKEWRNHEKGRGRSGTKDYGKEGTEAKRREDEAPARGGREGL